jgi:hypothetical protein
MEKRKSGQLDAAAYAIARGPGYGSEWHEPAPAATVHIGKKQTRSWHELFGALPQIAGLIVGPSCDGPYDYIVTGTLGDGRCQDL